jgi:xanthine/uracil permease
MPDAFSHFPPPLQLVLSNGIVVGAVAAVLLNSIFGKAGAKDGR